MTEKQPFAAYPMLERYMSRLRTALRDVPADDRRRILDGVEEHLAAAVAELSDPTEGDLRRILERLGEPEAIAAEAAGTGAPSAPPRSRLTLVLLWAGVVVGIFDLLAVSTSQVGPVEFVFLAVPVVVLVVLALGLRRQGQAPV